MTRLSVERVGQMLWWRRRLLLVLGLLLVIYAAAGFFLVPYLAKSAIENYVVRDLGLRVGVGEIAFNPFTLTAQIRRFAVTETDNTPIVSFTLLRVNAQISSLVNRAWTFKEVRLERPNLKVRIGENGSLNLAKLQRTAAASSPAQATNVPALRIATLSVIDGNIGFEDRNRFRSAPFTTTLAPIEFTLSDFRTAPSFQNEYNFDASTLAGEHFTWSGQFSVQPLGSNGHFAIANLKAATIAAYFGDVLPFELRSGSLDFEGKYRVAMSDKLHLNVDLPISRARNFGIAPRGDEASSPWIVLPAVDISQTSLSMQDRTVNFDRIQVDNAKVTAWRGSDGQLNLLELFGRPTTADVSMPTANTNPPSITGAPPAWTVGVGTIAIRTASVEAEDRMVQPPVQLSFTPVTLTLSGYSTKPGSLVKADAHVGIGSGEVAAQGDFSLAPLTSNLALDVSNFELPLLQAYVAASTTSLQLTSGKLALKGKLSLTQGGPGKELQPKIGADVTIADFATRDKVSNQNLFNWKSLRLMGVAYQQHPDRLDIERIEALHPYARVIISEKRTLNIAAALTPSSPVSGSPAAAPTPHTPATQSAPVNIRSVVIQDGTADFADFSVEPNFSAALMALNGGVSGLSSDARSRAEVKLSGSVDRYAPVDISGRVNLLSAALFTDIAANFHNMELTTFNPYSGKYAGYSISKGKLTTELRYKVENRKLDAQHHIVLDQIEFGAATDSKDKVPLPIRLAAALLKDRHGIIDINLPVSGSLDDPEFRVGPLIWKACVGLITKSITAPFHLLGSLFGRGEEIAYVDFAPGRAVLAPDQNEKIATLAKALVERPQLRLDVPLKTLTAADDEALSGAKFDEALAPLLPSSDASGVATQEQRMVALAQLYRQEFGTEPTYPAGATPDTNIGDAKILFLEKALRTRFTPTPDQRGELARARADAVQASLLTNTEISPERVFLTERESGKTTIPETVRMEFHLE